MYNHDNCKEIDNPKFCALVREDKTCLRERQRTGKKAQTKKTDPPIEGPSIEGH